MNTPVASATLSGQQAGDLDGGGGCADRHDLTGRQGFDAAITVRAGLSVHLDDSVDEVDDPVLGYARAGVEARLLTAIERERRSGDLDDESCGARVRAEVRA